MHYLTKKKNENLIRTLRYSFTCYDNSLLKHAAESKLLVSRHLARITILNFFRVTCHSSFMIMQAGIDFSIFNEETRNEAR